MKSNELICAISLLENNKDNIEEFKNKELSFNLNLKGLEYGSIDNIIKKVLYSEEENNNVRNGFEYKFYVYESNIICTDISNITYVNSNLPKEKLEEFLKKYNKKYNNRLESLNNIKDYVGKYLSEEFVQKNILKTSQEEDALIIAKLSEAPIRKEYTTTSQEDGDNNISEDVLYFLRKAIKYNTEKSRKLLDTMIDIEHIFKK